MTPAEATDERIIALGPRLPDDIGLPFARLADRRSTPDQINSNLALLTPRLAGLIGAPIAGLVIYGSARRVDDPGDIDALIVVDGPVRGGLWGDAGGHELDIFCAPLATVLAGPVERWPHLARGQVLYDPTDQLTPFIERVRAHREGPPTPPTAIEAVQMPVWARRQLGRIRRRQISDPTLAAMHRAGLIAALPELWRIARPGHGTSPTDWIRRTRATEPAFAAHLAALADPAAVDGALEAIVELLFPIDPPPG